MQKSGSSVKQLTDVNSQNETVPKTKLRKPTIWINQKFSSGYCETCGSYSSTLTEVYLNRVKLYSKYSDEHLYPGPTHEDIEALGPLFEALGYNFVYTKESDYLDD